MIVIDVLLLGSIAAVAATIAIIVLTASALGRINFMQRHGISSLREFFTRRNNGRQ